jgi:hypothetical protein
LTVSLVLLASVLVTSSVAGAQGGKGPGGKGPGGKPDAGSEAKEGAVKVTVAPAPKSVDEAMTKNVEKMKKECDQITEKIGSDVRGAQGLTIAFRAEESQDRVNQLTKLGEAMVFELAADFQVDAVKDLWASKQGPFQMFCFKSKASFGDAHREFLEKRFPGHNLEPQRKRHLDIGRFIAAGPSPLAAGEVDLYEHSMAHWIGQELVFWVTHAGVPSQAKKPTPPAGETPEARAAAEKKEMEQREKEDPSWLEEGFAIYASVRFVGANRVYCVSDTRYVGKTGMADKDLDTSYKLVCLEIAQGEEDKAKDFASLIKTEQNALNYLDLAKSWSFCDWMMRAENRPKFLAVMAGMRYSSFQTSVKNNLGWSLSDLESEWKKFVIGEYGGKKKTAPADPKAKGKDAPKDPKKKS